MGVCFSLLAMAFASLAGVAYNYWRQEQVELRFTEVSSTLNWLAIGGIFAVGMSILLVFAAKRALRLANRQVDEQ